VPDWGANVSHTHLCNGDLEKIHVTANLIFKGRFIYNYEASRFDGSGSTVSSKVRRAENLKFDISLM